MQPYHASPTASKFHLDGSFVKAMMGPIGSGKSVACCMEIMKQASTAPVGEGGVRRSRWLIARNSYRELKDTTIATWSDWFPPSSLGSWSAQDVKHTIEKPMADGTRLYLEVLFRSLDTPEDVKKLLSLELTGAWLNEAREMPRQVLDMLQGRVGRYPSAMVGGQQRGQIIMDTNPPDDDHWWYRMFEEKKPKGWTLFRQPSGVGPLAENIHNLPEGYYDRLMEGHDQQWVDVYVHGRYGFVQDGKPVFPMFDDRLHVLPEAPTPLRGTVYVGVDFGRTPAAVIGQQRADGQWVVMDEIVTEDTGAEDFAEVLGARLRKDWRRNTVKAWGDPAGDDRTQVDDRTPLKVLRAAGIPIVKCPFPGKRNDVVLRLGAVSRNLTKLTMTSKPRLVLSPKASTLRKALTGGYKYKRVQVSGEERYKDVPDKNKYSHVADALQYLMVGAGEAREVITSANKGAKDIKVIKTIRPRRRAGYGV